MTYREAIIMHDPSGSMLRPCADPHPFWDRELIQREFGFMSHFDGWDLEPCFDIANFPGIEGH